MSDTATKPSINYEITPFIPRPAVVHKILRSLLRFPSVFTGYNAPKCEQECHLGGDPCPSCRDKMAIVSWHLNAKDAAVWEVWETVEGDEEASTELIGIIYLTRVRPGLDAVGHYVFFDGDLRGKTNLLRDFIKWLMDPHEEEGWLGLQRLTVEIPEFAFALANHAGRYLGMGGPFDYTVQTRGGRKKPLKVEGVKQRAVPWNDGYSDLLILGITKDQLQ